MSENSGKSSNNPKVIEVVIDSEQHGQRIDNFLLSQLKGVPKTHIYRILRTGEVRANKGRIKPSYRLNEGDVIRIPPVRVSEPKEITIKDSTITARVKQRILFEDKDLIVVNKPAGLAVHGGSGVDYGLIEIMRELYPLAKRIELVHRLDRDTSGCLILAKKASVLKAMHEQVRGSGMEKIYLALLKGRLAGGSKKVDAPLMKNVLSSGERIVRVHPEGKESQTIFTPQQRFATATLVQARLLTGRTHQIRVHAQHIGHPLAGDEKYGDDEFNKVMRKSGLKRLFLHAHIVSFIHPVSGERVRISADLDDDLSRVLEQLGKDQ
ncbi:MAG: 23S rRNA pseudouridine(955/2504/2580) synthase RluC [Gammaproteobacteria bacterium]|nr:23S rRNA pseudouridine(955/2504/2580) synthase RluC [Gammaproteobacteria bacterium]